MQIHTIDLTIAKDVFTHRVDTGYKEDAGNNLGRLLAVGSHGRANNQRDQDSSTQHGEVVLKAEQQGGAQRRHIRDGIVHAILLGLFLVRLGRIVRDDSASWLGVGAAATFHLFLLDGRLEIFGAHLGWISSLPKDVLLIAVAVDGRSGL